MRPFVNLPDVQSFNFPGGEMHVILSEEQYNRETVDLTYEWAGNESLVKFLLTAHTFKEKGVAINCLHIPYVPFSP